MHHCLFGLLRCPDRTLPQPESQRVSSARFAAPRADYYAHFISDKAQAPEVHAKHAKVRRIRREAQNHHYFRFVIAAKVPPPEGP